MGVAADQMLSPLLSPRPRRVPTPTDQDIIIAGYAWGIAGSIVVNFLVLNSLAIVGSDLIKITMHGVIRLHFNFF